MTATETRTAPPPSSVPPAAAPQPARATRSRTGPKSSVLELEVPSSIDPKEIILTAVVPVKPGAGLPDLPAFLVGGIAADVQTHGRDWRGRPTSVIVSAPVDLTGKTPGSFARIELQPTGTAYQPSQVRDVPQLDLEFVLQTPDGVFRARPFADPARGERQLGRHRSTWKSWALLEGPRGETRGLVIACVEARADSLAVVEWFAVNGLQLYETDAAHAGDFCYQELELHTSSAIVLPMPRAGETVVRDGAAFVARLVGDGMIHLWPRMQGALRRMVVCPPDATPALLARASDVGRFFGNAFAIEGPNSWTEAGVHGPEQGFLAPWTDSLDVWGPKGQAGARVLLEQLIGTMWGQRTSGLAGNAFLIPHVALFHPLGQYQEGEPGGSFIRPVGSFALDRRLLLARWIQLEHTLDRTRAFHFEPRFGKPTSAAVWAQRFGGRVPFAWKNHGDGRFPWMALARAADSSIIRTPNVTQGHMVPHNGDQLLTYDEHDDQHEVREREPVETLARFTGSPMMLQILECFAVNAELARHELQSPEGDVTLAKLLVQTATKPASGSTNAGRGLAWDLAALVGFWEFAGDGWRSARKNWVMSFTRWALTSRGPSGILCNDPDYGHITEVAINDHHAPQGFRYVQTFEEAYMNFALEKLGRLALPGVASDREVRAYFQGIVDSFDALWSARLGSSNLVPTFVAVGFKNGGAELPQLSNTRASPDAESTWIWGMAACAARCALQAGHPERYRALMNGQLLQIGRVTADAGHPLPTLESYVHNAQALEREYWHGSADYSALAWGEAWAISKGGKPIPDARVLS